MKKRVIDDLRNDELLTAQELDSILIQAGITLDEAPPAKPQATGPALAAQDQKPVVVTPPAASEQDKPVQPGSAATGEPTDTGRPPAQPGKM